MSNRNYVLVLASGGIDSTACINFFIRAGFNVECLFINYGQQSLSKELNAVTLVAKHYGINVEVVQIDKMKSRKEAEIPGRNALFLFAALMAFSRESGIIATGIHHTAGYYDCS